MRVRVSIEHLQQFVLWFKHLLGQVSAHHKLFVQMFAYFADSEQNTGNTTVFITHSQTKSVADLLSLIVK